MLGSIVSSNKCNISVQQTSSRAPCLHVCLSWLFRAETELNICPAFANKRHPTFSHFSQQITSHPAHRELLAVSNGR